MAKPVVEHLPPRCLAALAFRERPDDGRLIPPSEGVQLREVRGDRFRPERLLGRSRDVERAPRRVRPWPRCGVGGRPHFPAMRRLPGSRARAGPAGLRASTRTNVAGRDPRKASLLRGLVESGLALGKDGEAQQALRELLKSFPYSEAAAKAKEQWEAKRYKYEDRGLTFRNPNSGARRTGRENCMS